MVQRPTAAPQGALPLLLLLSCISTLLVATAATPSKPSPPSLPSFFQGEFVEFTAPLTNPPPYVNGVPQAPFTATRGKVYYDYTISPPGMIEVRQDYCVNIFPDFDPTFECTFHNVDNISYLISNTSNLPNCCVFGDPWSPPEPSFLTANATPRQAWKIKRSLSQVH
jgi:hypothetical protein